MTRTNELRVASTVDDFEAAVVSYGRVLGPQLAARWEQPPEGMQLTLFSAA